MRYVIVDGNYQVHRSTWSGKGMVTSTGIMSGGTFLFLKLLYPLLEHGKIIVVFDGGHARFRKELYPDYKKREPKEKTPEQLEMDVAFETTFGVLKNLLPRMGLPSFSLEGQEADDVIFRLGQALIDIGHEVTVVSDDGDYLGMIRSEITVIQPMKDLIWNRDNFSNFHNLTPHQFTLWKALQGDKSDNIPGVKGIGPVAATKITQETNGDFSNLCLWCTPTTASPDSSAKKRVRENLDLVKRNLTLIDLEQTPLDKIQVFEEFQRAQSEAQVDFHYVLNKFKILEFHSLGQWLREIG